MIENAKTDKQGSNPSKKDGWLVSPSQIKTLQRSPKDTEGCDRKWGFVYVEGIRGPSTPAAMLGTETHSVLESFFSDGARPDTSTRSGLLARAALEVYPSRAQFSEYEEITKAPPLVEVGLSFDHDSVRYRGFADLLWIVPWCSACGAPVFKTKRGTACTNGHVDPKILRVPVVADHKTSSDPERWGLNTRTLPRDPQALIYANFALDWAASDLVDLQWTYLRTRGRVEAVPVRVALERSKAEKNFLEHVAPHGDKIMSLVREVGAGNLTRADQLEPNPLACGAFGGCPHASYCPRSPAAVLTSIFGVRKNEETTMNLRDKLAKKHGTVTDKPKDKDKKKGKGKGKDKKNKDKKGKDKDKNERGGSVEEAKAPKKRDKGKGRAINSPEAPVSPEVAREVSERVGRVAGTRKTKNENARKIATEAAGATTPEDAGSRCQVALDRIGRADVAPRDMILIQVAAGLTKFAPTKVRAEDLGLVFASGRTVMSLKRDGMIEVVRETGTDGGDVYEVSLLESGKKRALELAPELGSMPQLEKVGPVVAPSSTAPASKVEIDVNKLASGIAQAIKNALV